MVTSYIGADVDCKMTEIAIEQKQRIVARTVQKLILHKLFENRYLKSNRTNIIADFKQALAASQA